MVRDHPTVPLKSPVKSVFYCCRQVQLGLSDVAPILRVGPLILGGPFTLGQSTRQGCDMSDGADKIAAAEREQAVSNDLENGEYGQLGTDIAKGNRGLGIIDVVFAGISAGTGGISSIATNPFQRFLSNRVERCRNALLNDLAAGIIRIDDAVSEDDKIAFVYRVYRAAIEGCSVRKIRMIGYYVFGAEQPRCDDVDEFLYHASVIESLSSTELKAIAVLYNHWIRGLLTARSGDERDIEKKNTSMTSEEIDLLGLFPSRRSFEQAVSPLVRHGLVEGGGGFGVMPLFATERLVEFIGSLGPAAAEPNRS